MTVIGIAALHEGRFGIEFVLPERNVPVRQIRFDPGESGMLLIEKFRGYLEYEDGSTKQIDYASCGTNGFEVDGKIIFLGDDPQITISCDNGKRVKTAFFSGNASNKISQDLIEEAIRKKAEGFVQRTAAVDPMSRLKTKIKDTVKKNKKV